LKAAKVLDLLKQPCDSSVKELMKMTGVQTQSVRGFISGQLKKKLGLRFDLSSAKKSSFINQTVISDTT
jgi:hypothetical protein